MSFFIMEEELEKVRDKNTKEYLQEVISSYNNENYRSAIVVLYSIVIYDLLGKLKKLEDYYDDEIAKKIIEEVEKKQKNKTPEWEKLLLSQLKERTELLEEYEYNKINRLREDRNNCAHPLCNNNYQLIMPNREETRAHIRNMFEIVFKKDPLLSKKILEFMLYDMAGHHSRIPDIEKFKTYFKSKYLNHFGESVKKNIFKTMWKFVFILEDDNCNKNRYINFHILNTIIEENIEGYITLIKLEEKYYMNIKPSDMEINFFDDIKEESSRITALIYMIFDYPRLFKIFDKKTKDIIKTEADKSLLLSLLTYYYFDSDEKYIENLDNNFREYSSKIDTSYWKDIFTNTNMADSKIDQIIIKLLVKLTELENIKLIRKIINFLIEEFGKSNSYNYTEQFYDFFIKPCLKYFELDDFQKLFSKMNSNNQIYNSFNTYRGRKDIIEELKEKLKRFEKEIDYEKYENLKFKSNDDEDVLFLGV